MIDYQLLEALSSIVSEGGFEKAANKLFITQSAISRRIQTLESLLGEPVVIRSKPPKATAKGKRLLNHYQQVLQLELELGINSLSENISHKSPLTVRLATNADSLATWLPEALGLLDAETSQMLKFDIVVEDQSVILNKMKSGEAMACISSESMPINGGNAVSLGVVRYKAVASPLFLKRHQIDSLDKLSECPYLIFDENDKLQHQFLKEILNINSDYGHLIPSPEGFKLALIAGVGFGMLPELQLGDTIKNGKLVFLDEAYVLDVPLYWHYWQSEGPQMKELRKKAMAVAAKRLLAIK